MLESPKFKNGFLKNSVDLEKLTPSFSSSNKKNKEVNVKLSTNNEE